MSLQNDRPLRILSAGDLYTINEEVLGMAPLVRDHQVLRSAVKRPYLIIFGEEQFPSLLEKAAATMYSVAAHHIFADGNKRTAVRATEMFLEANGVMANWEAKEIEDFVLRIAKNELEIADIAVWLESHTEEID